MGSTGTIRNTQVFDSDFFLEFFLERRFVSPTRGGCGASFTGLEFCIDPQTTSCRLSPPLFFTVFGAAVFIIGTFPGSFPIACLRKLTALLPAEDLGGMIRRKRAIAGLEQAAALR